MGSDPSSETAAPEAATLNGHDPDLEPYPPAPWRMRGPAVVVAAPIRLDVARALAGDSVRVMPIAPGRALGCLLVADYRSGSTLEYGELASMVAPVGAGGASLGGWVTHMAVDLDASRRGGREMWGVPKVLASFDWDEGERTTVAVRDEAGDLLVRVSWRPPSRTIPIPARSFFAGDTDGPPRRASLRGTLRLAPVRVAVDIPASSPLSELGLGRPRISVAGSADVQAGPPRRI